LFLFTFFTVQHLSQVLFPARLCQHPWPEGHRRLVTNMLSMATSQIGHPITMLVQVKSNDRSVHGRAHVRDSISCPVTTVGMAAPAAPRMTEIATGLKHPYRMTQRTPDPSPKTGTP